MRKLTMETTARLVSGVFDLEHKEVGRCTRMSHMRIENAVRKALVEETEGDRSQEQYVQLLECEIERERIETIPLEVWVGKKWWLLTKLGTRMGGTIVELAYCRLYGT